MKIVWTVTITQVIRWFFKIFTIIEPTHILFILFSFHLILLHDFILTLLEMILLSLVVYQYCIIVLALCISCLFTAICLLNWIMTLLTSASYGTYYWCTNLINFKSICLRLYCSLHCYWSYYEQALQFQGLFKTFVVPKFFEINIA